MELKVTLKPEITGPFDVKLYVDLRGGKCITLRIAGSVEDPIVSVSKVLIVYVLE